MGEYSKRKFTIPPTLDLDCPFQFSNGCCDLETRVKVKFDMTIAFVIYDFLCNGNTFRLPIWLGYPSTAYFNSSMAAMTFKIG